MIGIWQQAMAIWQSGGWAMTLLAVNAFILFFIGLAVKIKLREKGYRPVSEKTCRVWIENPQTHNGKGTLGRLIEFVMNSKSMQQVSLLFKEFRQEEIVPFVHEIRIMRVCVGASPLLGLLGTVSGMLTMFHALSMGSAGEKTLGMVASGISEALITTETGLIIALPGLFLAHHLQHELDRYEAFLSRMETVCAQSLHRMFSGPVAVPDDKVSVPSLERALEILPALKPEIVLSLQHEAA